MSCDCDPDMSLDTTTCDVLTGQCACRPGVIGRQCDACPSGFIGPSVHTGRPCVRCFCNGYPANGCESDEGWFQARVSNDFEVQMEAGSFTSPGTITFDPE